jgi:diacylglycerol kinase family enzyme
MYKSDPSERPVSNVQVWWATAVTSNQAKKGDGTAPRTSSRGSGRVRILIVNNIKAGQGDAGLYDYLRRLSLAGAEVTLRALREAGSLDHALRDAEEFDRVVAAGGDGTVSSIAYALRGSGIPIVAYPAGTANILALNLMLPLDPKRLADTTLAGRTMRVDLGELTCETCGKDVAVERRRFHRPRPRQRIGFSVMAGAGFDASIVEGARELKSVIGAGAYLVSAMANLEPTFAEIRLDLDGREVVTEGSAVILVNFARLQFDLTIAHDSDATDGLFEVVVIKARHVTDLIPAVLAAWLDRIVDFPDRSQAIESYRAKRIEVVTAPALPLQTDGDLLEGSTPFSARVLPMAATFVVPAGSEGRAATDHS